MASGTGQADNWSGGTAGFEVHYLSTDANGIASYDVISANNSDGPQVLRVLHPTNPAPGVPHNFLFVLPVEPGLGDQFGDGLETLRGARRAGPVQPDDHRALVRDRSLVRGQPRPTRPSSMRPS